MILFGLFEVTLELGDAPLKLFEFVLMLLYLSLRLFNQTLEMIELPENMGDDGLVPLVCLLCIVFGFTLLLLVLFDFRVHASSTIQLKGLLFCGRFRFCLQFLIFGLGLEAA